MYKIIACDLDETLLSSDHHVSKGNIEAIKKAKQAGVKFVLATGRGFKTVQGTLEEVGLQNLENEYVISFNGGAITENKDNKLLHFSGITFEKAEAIFKAGLKHEDLCLHVYTRDMTYIYNMVEFERQCLGNKMAYELLKEPNIDFLKNEPIVKCLYMHTNRDYLQEIEKEIEGIVYDCDVSYSSNRYIEFNRKGVNKGKGLRDLAKLLNVDIKDTIAIGDNINDLPMILEAGLGIGVANTIEVMRKDCDIITENDNDHDAIAEVIYKYVLN